MSFAFPASGETSRVRAKADEVFAQIGTGLVRSVNPLLVDTEEKNGAGTIAYTSAVNDRVRISREDLEQLSQPSRRRQQEADQEPDFIQELELDWQLDGCTTKRESQEGEEAQDGRCVAGTGRGQPIAKKHGLSDLADAMERRLSERRPNGTRCMNFDKFGHCAFGEACTFVHDLSAAEQKRLQSNWRHFDLSETSVSSAAQNRQAAQVLLRRLTEEREVGGQGTNDPGEKFQFHSSSGASRGVASSGSGRVHASAGHPLKRVAPGGIETVDVGVRKKSAYVSSGSESGVVSTTTTVSGRSVAPCFAVDDEDREDEADGDADERPAKVAGLGNSLGVSASGFSASARGRAAEVDTTDTKAIFRKKKVPPADGQVRRPKARENQEDADVEMRDS